MKGRAAAISGGLLLAAFLAWCLLFVTPVMDEFTPLHRLACLYPYASLHTFRESCSAYRIDFPFLSYYRPYVYVGTATGWLYFPVWSLWRSAYSYELLGVVCLGVFAVAMTRVLRVPLRVAPLVALYFPIAHALIHDTGPTKIALLSIPALGLLAQRAVRTSRKALQMLYGIAGGAVIAIAVEDKPFYLWLLPLVGLCVAAFVVIADDGREPPAAVIRRAGLALLSCAVVAGAAIGVLLFAGRVNDSDYTRMLLGRGVDSSSYFWSLSRIASYLPGSRRSQLDNILAFTFQFPLHANMSFAVEPGGYAAWAALMAAMLYAIWRARLIKTYEWMLFVSAYVACAVVFVATRTSWANHHYVTMHVPVIAVLLLAAARGGTRLANTVWAYVAATAVLTVTILSVTPVHAKAGRERASMFAYLSRPDVAASNVINFSSGGGYSHQSLYGDRAQLVTYIEPLNARDASRLVPIARSLSRNIVDACIDCTRRSIADAFPGAGVSEIGLGLREWKVFEIEVPRR